MKKPMKFITTIKSTSTLKKKKEYKFSFDEKDIKKGLKATFLNPHLVVLSANKIYALYGDRGFLEFNYFLSYQIFEEISLKHMPKVKAKKKKLSTN